MIGQLWWQFYPINYPAQPHPGISVRMTIPPDDSAELQSERDLLEVLEVLQ